MEKIIIFLVRYKVKLIVTAIIILLSIIGVLGFLLFENNQREIEKVDESLVLKEEKEEKVGEEVVVKKYLIDIKGAVKNPGVYSIIEGSSVIDVIKVAGGLKAEADTKVLNLSKRVFDEMVIVVYTKEEVNNFVKIKEEEEIKVEKCQAEETVKNDACIDNSEEKTDAAKININTATLEELMTLTGIGESKAGDIIAYRESNGLFVKIEDIMNVSGIGASTFAKIKENITV